ncbi:protein Iojap-related, mitochondrial-like [Apium graveolens]|uniref:protein Iojap-related, mitochondrial-like n=1 Tax=Apium graveolens TaxID=4045 RepID=UPI003D79F55A
MVRFLCLHQLRPPAFQRAKLLSVITPQPPIETRFHRTLSSLNKIDLISSLVTDNNANTSCATSGKERKDILSLPEVEKKILSDVRADNVKAIPVQNHSFTDHVVLATGRSAWHVRNIAQALFYKAKLLKQRGSDKKLLPTVEGQKGGKWIVVDSGSLVIHALDEKMRAYYDLDALWTEEKKITSEERQLEWRGISVFWYP